MFRLPGELSELIPWEVYVSSDIAQHHVREGLRVLMSQPLHKEVRVKDHRLAGVRLFLAGKHTASCPPVGETHGGWVGVHFGAPWTGKTSSWCLKLNYAVKTEAMCWIY